MVRPRPAPPFRPPRVDAWNWRIAMFLGGAWIVEMVLENAGLPVMAWFAWADVGAGYAPWQILTWPLVQGRQVLSVLIQLYILGSILPAALGGYSPKQIRAAALWMFGGGILVAFSLNGLGHLLGSRLAFGQAHGWHYALTGLFALFGLRNPDGVVNLFFVLPIRAELFVWLAIGLPALFWLAAIPSGNTLGPAVAIGCWAGAYLWYHQRRLLSPRRRKLKRKARKLRADLKVLKGGKDDETWH